MMELICCAEESEMEHSVWVDQLLDRVCEIGEEGEAAMQYVRKHKTKIGFKRVRPNVGAFWTLLGSIHLNSQYYDYETPLDDVRIRTLIIHEVRHLQQGLPTALSVYGELDAWQLEFDIYHRIKGIYPSPIIAEIMTLPLEYDRDVLRKSVSLMQAYAGNGYRADLLPLFPWRREIRYWILRK
jgi:hypothetical protein